MRVAVHDYPGHPFQLQLSRELARRGHDVLHLYCTSVSAARGTVEVGPDDPAGLAIEGISLDAEFEKYSPLKRVSQEWAYGALAVDRIRAFRPDVVLSANTPLLAQHRLQAACRRDHVTFVFWLQDLLGVGIRALLGTRMRGLGRPVGGAFVHLERRMLRRSDAVVAISDDFRDELAGAHVATDRVHVIENWAPLDEVEPRPHDNAWAAEHGLTGKRVLLYSGTLGLKHRPELLLECARRFRDDHDVRVAVVAEGPGADWLRDHTAAEGLDNILQLPFQPYQRLSEVLATGDVLVVILGHDAGRFSVPSKTLTYHCAERALLLAVPAGNLSGRIVTANGAGVVVDPLDTAGFVDAARRLLDDPSARAELAASARRYATTTFDIHDIGRRFEAILTSPSGTRSRPHEEIRS